MKQFRRLSLSDKAAVANLVVALLTLAVAIIAIVISLYTFSSQLTSDQEQKASMRRQETTLDQSRDSLKAAAKSLDDQRKKLARVAGDLDIADRSLKDLAKHSLDQVAKLNAADAALQRMVVAANSEYAIEKKTASVSAGQLALLNKEYLEQVKREKQNPSFQMALTDLDNGATFDWNILQHKGIVISMVRGSTSHWKLKVWNSSDITAPDAYVVIHSPSGRFPIGGCVPTDDPGAMQCNSPHNMYGNIVDTIPFTIAAPTATGWYQIVFQVITHDSRGRGIYERCAVWFGAILK